MRNGFALFLMLGTCAGASACGSDDGLSKSAPTDPTGGGAQPPTQPPTEPPTTPPTEPPPPATDCGLHTGYAGDDQCILPPPPDKGFQVHVGPTDYANPEAAYLLKPGEEQTTDFNVTATNDKDGYFYYRQYRMRPTAHHVILSSANGSDVGRRIGTANMSEDFPTGGIIPPEDHDIGSPIAAHAPVTVSFHAINAGDKPQLREVWVNFWYRDPSEVTKPATEWFKMGSTSFAIQPHTATTLGPYTCTVQGDGRLLWLYGHRHANNVRFTVTRVRGSQRDVIYDANKWEEPLMLQYSSLVTNKTPDIDNGIEGGWNGILDLKSGDQIEWQCGVVNQNDSVLRFSNQTYLGEMCIVDAEAVGSTCSGL